MRCHVKHCQAEPDQPCINPEGGPIATITGKHNPPAQSAKKPRRNHSLEPRLGYGRCRCGNEGRLLASAVLEAEVCAECLVAGASARGWLRDSDVQFMSRDFVRGDQP